MVACWWRWLSFPVPVWVQRLIRRLLRVHLGITLAPCATPEAYIKLAATITELDRHAVNVPWSHTWSAGDSDEIAIPGASFDIYDIVGAGLYADVGIAGSLSTLNLWVGFDVCGSLGSEQYCGSELVAYFKELQCTLRCVNLHPFVSRSLLACGYLCAVCPTSRA